MKVLIVDDHQVERDKYASHVEGLGHEVVLAEDGRQAADILMATGDVDPSIRAVITDTRMGNHSGVWLLQFISRNDPPPCLLHSTETGYREKGYDFDLPTVIPDAFGFAEFHLKEDDLAYLTHFLAKIV